MASPKDSDPRNQKGVKPMKSIMTIKPNNNKTIIGCGFYDIQNNLGLGKSYQLKPKAEAGNSYWDLDYSGYLKNRIEL